MSETAESQSKRGARFSLLALPLLTTIVGLGTTVVLLYSSRSELRGELKEMRESRGQLYIEDRTKLHAISIASPGSRHWRWRIYIPPGKRYQLNMHGGPVPKEGLPDSGEISDVLEPGEHVVAYRVIEDSADGEPIGTLEIDDFSRSGGKHPWAEWVDWRGRTQDVGPYTQSFEPTEPVVMLRHRVSATAKKSSTIEDPSAGLLIWLEPQ
ncbi:hypothetical protein NG895_11340 [Aeoliella sp. ICT_H6.2]|uniref:Uncharacterized protein n=1 Tax=Aeoliella straminimaris TaxID=2954799 RepID=A0A9X2F9Q5_9BACT|nr:hypothetical protein [Aeoliella straminimaris]MCO6044499.1 hypothetical protein [Aeoliella straminimaris]